MRIIEVALYLGETRVGRMTNREAVDYLNEKGFKEAVTAVHPTTGEKFYKGIKQRSPELRSSMKEMGYTQIYFRKIPR